MRYNLLLLILAFLSTSMMVSAENPSNSVQKKWNSDQVLKCIQIEMLIEFPPNAMPKKGFVTIGGSIGNYAIRDCAF